MLHHRKNGASGQRRRLRITRFLLALGFIAALVMAAYKPARGAPTEGERCTAAKISATGKYALCRMQAEAKAEKTETAVDFSKCADTHTRAFERAEAKHGPDCLTSGDAGAVQSAVGAHATRMACLLKGLSDGGAAAGAAIVSVRDMMVCLQVDAPDLSPVPTYAANLAASVTPPGECPREGIGIALGGGNNGDATLMLGSAAFNEYGACPASIGAARIENCWSNSAFTFDCI